jgi:hypothetical protein
MAIAGIFGAVVVFSISQGSVSGGDAQAQRLLDSLGASADRPSRPPDGLSRSWAGLYRRLNEIIEERRTAGSALAELERFRRQVESAAEAYRNGKDPLTEIAELRVGPLRELLEAAKEGVAVGPVVSRLPLGEEELVGVDGEPLPEPWPAGADDPSSLDPRVRAEARRGLEELIRGLSELARTLASGSTSQAAPSSAEGVQSPAQLVDAVVQTAADGIEDLAAGLMRANELASVAERVTNRATLLALNAALEATRSGSEAFAAIAEETRKLAEFAREATDKISLLASEIEYKVGETITAIHATSEHAKSSLAGRGGSVTGGGAPALSVVESLLARAREVRTGLTPGPAPPGATPTATPAPPVAAATVDVPFASDGNDLDEAPTPDDEGPTREHLVENAPTPAEKNSTGDLLMLEGLEPGAGYRE